MNSKSNSIVHSYRFSFARYELSVYEKRVMYQIVEYIQNSIKKNILKKQYVYQGENLVGVRIPLSVANVMSTDQDEHYTRVKKALKSLSTKCIEVEDEQIWKSINLIAFPEIIKNKRIVNFLLDKDLFGVLLDYGNGYRRFELAPAMKLSSVYAMRFYELFSQQKKTITYTIFSLREMFQLSIKYNKNGDFIKEVIDRSKRELDAKAPYSFTYETVKDKQYNKKGGRPKIVAIKFTPVYHPENRDKRLLEKEHRRSIRRHFPIRSYLSSEIESILKEKIGFTETEIKNNYELFHQFKLDQIRLDDRIVNKALKAKNPKGYLIGILKKRLVKEEQFNQEKLAVGQPSVLQVSQKKALVSVPSNHSDISYKEAQSIVQSIFEGEKDVIDDNIEAKSTYTNQNHKTMEYQQPKEKEKDTIPTVEMRPTEASTTPESSTPKPTDKEECKEATIKDIPPKGNIFTRLWNKWFKCS